MLLISNSHFVQSNMEIALLVLPLILASAAALQCDTPGEFIGEPGVCLGTLIHTEEDTTIASCQDACTNYSGCNYYTRNPDTQTCFMFDACPELDDSCAGCASGSSGCDLDNDENGKNAHIKVFELKQMIKIVGYFIMSIGGYKGYQLDDVELTSLDPELFPVPDCLTNLNPLPYPRYGMFGALDYFRK